MRSNPAAFWQWETHPRTSSILSPNLVANSELSWIFGISLNSGSLSETSLRRSFEGFFVIAFSLRIVLRLNTQLILSIRLWNLANLLSDNSFWSP